MHPIFEEYGIKHLSISQVKNINRSPFAWVCEKVLGRRSPDTEATAFGSFVHANFDRWLKGKVGEPTETHCPDEYKEFFVEAWAPKTLRFWEEYRKAVIVWPEAKNVEVNFVVDLDPELPPFIGLVDVFLETDESYCIQDHKTIGNKSFAHKTPEDVASDPQLCLYAHALVQDYDKTVRVQHNQLFKKIKRKPVNILSAVVSQKEIALVVEGVRIDGLKAIKILESYRSLGIKGFAKSVKQSYERTRWDFGGCPHWDFFQECIRKDIKLDDNKEEEGGDDMPVNLHTLVGKARSHFIEVGYMKFELADSIVEAVMNNLVEKEIKAVYVRDGEGGDLIYNQLLNRVAEQGIMLFKRMA